ncbi:hypothetical protein UCREL1_7232 [Eutypa lata UCREL1]|uniref:Uncharacterized protein n=1 Tax=Eutypa lata (strain UCR-EL1) TaxID=1287681 RepID=M7T7K0_EUTLA|nr:hypothetical protein UCREL1_7232 [Eutypa lata UCREL1]
MLDDDFNQKMAALDQNQREATASHASTMDSMRANLSEMSNRFEAEMKSSASSSSSSSSSAEPSSGSGGDVHQKGEKTQQQKQQKQGMREQMDRGEAVKEVKQGRVDVGERKRVV